MMRRKPSSNQKLNNEVRLDTSESTLRAIDVQS